MEQKKLGYLSPTKIEKARVCEARLYAQLHDDEYEEEQGEAALIGTLAHAAAKHFYRPKDFVRDASGLIIKTVYGCPDQETAWKLAMEECQKPDPIYGRPQLPREPSGIQDARTMFDAIVAHYKRDALIVLATERRYKGTMANGVPVHTIIDLVVQRTPTRIEIVDYKTGWLAIATDDMYDKDQCLINMLQIRRDPELQQYTEVSFSYFWVRKGCETGPISLTDARLADYEQFLSYEYQRLLDVKNPQESLNRFCGSCGRKQECTKYREFLSEAMGEIAPLTKEKLALLSLEDQLAYHERLKGQYDMLEKNRKIIGELLMEEATKTPEKVIQVGKYKAKPQQNTTDSINVATVLRLCAKYGKDASVMLSASKKKVEEVFADIPEAMFEIQTTMRRMPNAAFLNVTVAGAKRKSTKKAKEEVEETAEQLSPSATAPAPSNPAPTTGPIADF